MSADKSRPTDPPILPPPQDWVDRDGHMLPGIFESLEEALRTGRIKSFKDLLDEPAPYTQENEHETDK